MSTPDIDLGHDHHLTYFGWTPDRDLNPQYVGIPDEERAGAIVRHLKADGSECSSGVTFDVPAMRATRPSSALWQVESWDPLTISPSLLCECGDHGFIRDGRWVPA